MGSTALMRPFLLKITEIFLLLGLTNMKKIRRIYLKNDPVFLTKFSTQVVRIVIIVVLKTI